MTSYVRIFIIPAIKEMSFPSLSIKYLMFFITMFHLGDYSSPPKFFPGRLLNLKADYHPKNYRTFGYHF